ncbi:helix-turn-helix domain-containing protein [Anaerobacillus alkaliphilus]|uniref:Helix-turn-helix domain-containing protein n=1 Tax=Anaerobacillus alkaliphilus TaxID=1548597 RepID=A0A4Q0VV70_9BACI|nr:helix-turn-helix domain-containing protein [Anaerobacillus alkaliphilus]RXJ00627.1 helix-turn-helix domain-containing protein [Anaerobacillus alkaliphilus]
MLKVVIADLEPIQRKCIKALLQERYRRQVVVLETDNGQEACEYVEKDNIDLVIMDHRLTGMNGLTSAVEMRRHNPLQKLMVFTMEEDPQLKKSFNKLGVKQYIKKPSRPRILIDLISKGLSETPQLPARKVTLKISEIVQFIEGNLNRDLTLTYVAEKMNLSSYYLSKMFKKELGVNFVKYVTDRKMEKAKELLKNFDVPIINIAFAIGYAEPSYFTKVFKRVENMTPSQYRNQFYR